MIIHFVDTLSNDRTVLFLTIQFSISHLFALGLNVKNCSIWLIDRTLSGAATPSQSGLGSEGNEGVLHIPQSPNVTWTSPSGYLVSYVGYSLVGVLRHWRDVVSVFFSPSKLGRMVYCHIQDTCLGCLTSLQRWSRGIQHPPSRLGQLKLVLKKEGEMLILRKYLV